MATFGILEKMALTFPEVSVEPHFEKISFRVRKKIFLTYDDKSNRATVKLSEIAQNDFLSTAAGVYPVDNKWGKQGWTFVELSEVGQDLLNQILTEAYCGVAPKKLVNQIRPGKSE